MRQVSSVLSPFMLFPVAFATGLYARQDAALVTLVALKLALKSGLGCGFAVALSDSTASMEFTEKGAICFEIFFSCLLFFLLILEVSVCFLCAYYLYCGIASFLILCCDYTKC